MDKFCVANIKGSDFKLTTADNFIKRAIGLAWQKDVRDGADGMLFAFKNKARRPFWMFGMRFDLDILWIDNDEVVGFEKLVPHTGLVNQIRLHRSKEPVDKVLELKPGVIDFLEIEIGDKITI